MKTLYHISCRKLLTLNLAVGLRSCALTFSARIEFWFVSVRYSNSLTLCEAQIQKYQIIFRCSEYLCIAYGIDVNRNKYWRVFAMVSAGNWRCDNVRGFRAYVNMQIHRWVPTFRRNMLRQSLLFSLGNLNGDIHVRENLRFHVCDNICRLKVS